jgi:hypothetical protein
VFLFNSSFAIDTVFMHFCEMHRNLLFHEGSIYCGIDIYTAYVRRRILWIDDIRKK